MQPSTTLLHEDKIIHLLHQLLHEKHFTISLIPEKHQLLLLEDSQKILTLRLPLLFPKIDYAPSKKYNPLPQPEMLSSYFTKIDSPYSHYLILLIQAGQAALGLFQDEELLAHKVIRRYMVRKKQGKAQISHLKTKGKSRQGSRIRLHNSQRFFEEINEKLSEWPISTELDAIFYSASPQLWSLLFQSHIQPPFAQKNPKLIKIPKDIPTPTLKVLLSTQKFLKFGQITLFQPLPASLQFIL